MNIVTKYDMGQQVYFWEIPYMRRGEPLEEDKRQISGNIIGVTILENGNPCYKVRKLGSDSYYTDVKEEDISIMPTEIINPYDVFLAQFPELNEHEKEEIKHTISDIRRAALKRLL